MTRIFRNNMPRLFTGASALVFAFAWLHLAVAQASHHHLPAPPPPVSAPPIRPPTPVPVVPSRPVVPPPTIQKTGLTAQQKAEIERLQGKIELQNKDIRQREAEIKLLEEEIADKEQTIATLNERIAIFSQEKDRILAERNDIRESLESYRQKLTDNEFFMKVGINMRTAAVAGHPVTLGLIDHWIGNMDRQIKFLPENMAYLQREYIDPVSAKLQAWIEWANNQPASQREAQMEWGLRMYEPSLASYEKRMQEYRDKLSDCMAAKDQLLEMRPTVEGAEDRIRQIELRAVELDRLIREDAEHRNSVRGIDAARARKEQLERSLEAYVRYKESMVSALNELNAGTGGSKAIAAVEPVPEPAAPEPVPVEPAPETVAAETKPAVVPEAADSAADIADIRQKLQQDVEFHLQNRDRAQAELRSIQQRSGTEEQQANLRARIAASEEFALAAGRELTRLGGSVTDYVRNDLSDYDPYKLNQTDKNLMELSARQRAENEVTDQIIKTREFIRNTTDQADAIDLIQKLERIAGFNNQGGLQDFERLDAVREFRRAVYETRTQADFAKEMLDATMADIDNTAYEIGAGRVKTGATLAVALGTGALGMTAMAGSAGLITLASGTGALVTTQAAAASKVLLVYNISTGTISGYSESGVKGAVEGGSKEVLPINTYIAIRDGKGAGTIAVGLWQDAGNVFQIYSFAKTLKTAAQTKAVANVESGLEGSDAALNRLWKLDQAQADFLATQMSAQATTLNTMPEGSSNSAKGSTPAQKQNTSPAAASASKGANAPSMSVNSTPMGESWDAQMKAAAPPFKASEGITGLEKLGMSNATVDAALPMGLTGGATMDEVQAAGRELVKNFDTRVLPAISAGNTTAAGTEAMAGLGLTPTLERQVDIIRGMSEGRYSPIVADKMSRQETGQGLAEAMARLSGTVEFIKKL
jgi:hypothetical protein